MNSLTAITHIIPIATIRRERFLPVPGRVVVRRGQHVYPSDVVAEAITEPEHILMDIGRGLGLPPHEADRYLTCKDGTQVGAGDVLAGPVGMARRLVRAPHDGTVIVSGEGQLLLQLALPPYELKAAYQGVVADLIGDRGVIIETTGALIQGVWGNGRTGFGLLNVLTKAPDDQLLPSQLDVSLRGAVVLGGYCADEEVFRVGNDLPLRGLILASMHARLLPAANQVGYPVIVLEGFGKIPMNPAAFKLLSSSERRDVTLNANRWDHYKGTRPEVLMAVPPGTQAELPDETGVIAAGKRVRVISSPYQGKLAVVVSILGGLTVLPSGISAPTAQVRFEDNETSFIPLANLDLLD
jgi:hypothetical protein